MKPRCFLLPATLPFFLLAYLSSCGEGHDDAHADGHADAHDEAPDERDPRSVALPCGHAYHLRCMLAVLDARTETPLCPSCRRPVRRDGDDETPPRRAETVRAQT